MKLHLKLTSVLLSAVMCASMVMAPVSVIADETSAPEETQTTEATEKEETKETEKKTPKATEKPEPKESKATEKTEPEETKETEPEETVKETEPTESEDKKPAETEETEASKPEEKKPAESNKEEPSEPATTSEPKKEDVPETTLTPETGEKEETHRVPRKNAGGIIDSVSITLDAPVIGAKPDYTAEFPDGANYFSAGNNDGNFRNDILWLDTTVKKTAPIPTDQNIVFKAGHSYSVRIFLSAKTGFFFTDQTTVKLNGKQVEASLYGEDGTVLFIYDYAFPKLEGTATDIISNISITLDAPVVGNKPDYTASIPSGMSCYVGSVVWFDLTANREMDPDSDKFKVGHQYRVFVNLNTKDGSLFDGTGSINGKKIDGFGVFGADWRFFYTFPALEGTATDLIDSVSVTIDAPVVGAKPYYTAVFPAGAKFYSDSYNSGYFRNYIRWYDHTIGTSVDPDSGVFEAGHQYSVLLILTASDGLCFSPNVTGTVNDQIVDSENVSISSSGLLHIAYVFPKLEGIVNIDSVSISLDNPIVGASPDYTATLRSVVHYSQDVSRNNGYVQNGIQWFYETEPNKYSSLKPASGVFEVGNRHLVEVYLVADDGYAFTNSTTAVLNGNTAEVLYYSGGRVIKVSYLFPVLTYKIPFVSVTLDEPVAGAKPDYTAEFSTGANYNSASNSTGNYRNGILWKDITTGSEVNPETGEFKAGHQYSVTVYLSANDSFGFADDITGTLNGKALLLDKESDYLKLEYTFPIVMGNVTDLINSFLVSIDAPLVGAKPDYSAVFPSGANYYSDAYNEDSFRNDIAWYDITSGNYVNPDSGVFEAGHQYSVRIFLTLNDGFYSSPDADTKLNGQSAVGSKFGSQWRLDYTFPVLTEAVVGDTATVGDFNYKVTNANTDGTGTVTLTGVAVKKASVSVPSVVNINGFIYKVNRIGTKAFYGDKKITSLTVGSNVVIIDSYAFYGCSNLTKVSGGKVLKTIGTKAFAYCSKLKSFSIASSVLNKIGSYAFQKDKKLKTVYIKYTTRLTKSGVKKSLKKSSVKTVKVKKSKVKKYKKYFKKKNSGRSVKVKK